MELVSPGDEFVMELTDGYLVSSPIVRVTREEAGWRVEVEAAWGSGEPTTCFVEAGTVALLVANDRPRVLS